jgi:hypothetical protein
LSSILDTPSPSRISPIAGSYSVIFPIFGQKSTGAAIQQTLDMGLSFLLKAIRTMSNWSHLCHLFLL